jgi:subtilase family serine protease
LIQDGGAVAPMTDSDYTVLLTEPADNTEYMGPASITLAASAVNSKGAISKVEFYQGETLLGAVTETPYNFTWNNVTAGNYVLTVRAYDELGASVKSTPVHISVAPPPALADLVIDSLTVLPTLAKEDQPVIITATVRNAGGATANNFEIDLYQNLMTQLSASQAGDVTCMVSSLAPGASTICTGTVSYSTVGTYIVRAQVDRMNVVAEAREHNNETGFIRVIVKLPDLVISKLTVSPAMTIPGQLITLAATVKNTGEVDAGAFEVDIYQGLANAPVISQEGDVTCNIQDLAAKTSTTCSGTVTYTGTGTGVWAQVDTMNTVDEADENNNVAGLATKTNQ